LEVRWLGTVEYDEATKLQEERARARRSASVPDTLFLLEHPPVITLGRGADERNVLETEEELARTGILLRRTGRGGDVTYHGPGQLVGYSVIALRGRDVHRYLRDLETVLLRSLADFGIHAERSPGFTGVWVGPSKIAAIGVRLSRWVTSHGFALNVDPDLSPFSRIVPCGIRTGGVTSMARLLGKAPSTREVAARVAARFVEVFRIPAAPSTSEAAC